MTLIAADPSADDRGYAPAGGILALSVCLFAHPVAGGMGHKALNVRLGQKRFTCKTIFALGPPL
jgi:hypothetical protein